MPRDVDHSDSTSQPEKDPQSKSATPRGERLQKVLAAAGIGSRRDCETLILDGRIEVDGEVVNVLGTRVDPKTQHIRVDGESLRNPKRLYFAVNKPAGVVTTNSDPAGRTRVIDLVPTQERVFAVGRLDRASEGLIIVTNDGELSDRITHPRYGVEKQYLVRIAGTLDDKELDRLRRGIHLSDGLAKVVSLRIRGSHKQSTDLEIVLNEGKNREIRRMLARVGHKVLWLKRISIGGLRLGELAPGDARHLSSQEVADLLAIQVRKRKPKEKTGGAAAGSGPSKVSRPERPQRPASMDRAAGPPPRGPKPVGGKRPTSRYKEDQERMGSPPVVEGAFPPIDDELQLDDFLPSNDDLGGGSKAGGVIDYGDDAEPTGESKGGRSRKLDKDGKPNLFVGKHGGDYGKSAAARAAGGGSGGRPGSRPGGRPAGGAAHRGPRGEGRFEGGRPPYQAGGRPGGRPGGRFQNRGEGAAAGEGPPERSYGGRPGGRPSGGRPTGRPGGRPGRPSGRFQDRPAGGEGGPRGEGRPAGGRPPRKFGSSPGGRSSGPPGERGGRSEGRASGGRPSGGRPSGGRPGGRPGRKPSGGGFRGKPGGGRKGKPGR